jgi:hypothetical protein
MLVLLVVVVVLADSRRDARSNSFLAVVSVSKE